MQLHPITVLFPVFPAQQAKPQTSEHPRPRCGFVSHPCREGKTSPTKPLHLCGHSAKGLEVPMARWLRALPLLDLPRGPSRSMQGKSEPGHRECRLLGPAPFSPLCRGSPQLCSSLRSSCPCRAPHGPSETSPPPAAPPPASLQPRPTATPAVPWKSTWSPPQTPRPPRWAAPGPRGAPFAPALPQGGQTHLQLERSRFIPLIIPSCFPPCAVSPGPRAL